MQQRYALLATILITVHGCAIHTQSEDSHTSRQQVNHSSVNAPPNTTDYRSNNNVISTPTAAPRTPTNNGVATLLQQAAQARAAGDLGRAQSLAERAQTLEPRQGHSYLELAKIYEAKGDHPRAKQMALRGTSYAGDDVSLRESLQIFNNP
jgi:hypothetical protein